jgi:hypothetical protein
MSDSSAPVAYSTISNDGAVSGNAGFIAQEVSSILPDVITMSSLPDVITMSSDTSSYYYGTGLGGGTITISGGSGYSIGGQAMTISSNGNVGIGTGTISNMNASSFIWKSPEEFVNAFPDFDRIEKMCKEYPGLSVAFEKFKTVYNLVKDHYDTPEDQRPKP